MRFRSNEPPIGYGGLFFKPRYNQRFITGGMMPSQTKTETQALIPIARSTKLPKGVTIIDSDEEEELAPVQAQAPAPVQAQSPAPTR